MITAYPFSQSINSSQPKISCLSSFYLILLISRYFPDLLLTSKMEFNITIVSQWQLRQSLEHRDSEGREHGKRRISAVDSDLLDEHCS